MRFLIRIYRAGGNYSALVPDLPGCVAAADTIEETCQLMAGAIALHMEGMQQTGEPIPNPSRSMEFVIDDSEEEEYCTWVEPKAPKRKPKRSQQINKNKELYEEKNP